MKRAMTMLGALAVAAAGFLFAAPAAHAASLQTITNGGVTCEQWPTNYGEYPNTYWVCTTTHANPTGQESVVGQLARTLPAGMKTVFANVELMIFTNRNDFAAFTGAAAPAAKYMAWTAPNGPGALSGKKIAAVFKNADLYSPNIAPTNVIATRDLTGYYKVHIMQALGRWHDQLGGNPSTPQAAPVHIFPIAVNYDRFWTDFTDPSVVWGATIDGWYPNLQSFQILGQLYGDTFADIYAFQFATKYGSNWSHLQSFINSYLKETEGFRKQQIFNEVTALPVTGTYNAGTGQGVYCVEYTTVYAQPADKILDCVHPYGSTAGERQAGTGINGLPAGFKTMLVSSNVKLHVLYDAASYNVYYPGSAAPTVGVLGYSENGNGRTAAFRVFRDGNNNAEEVYNYYPGTLVHEAGHILDVNHWSNYSQGAAWAAIVNADKNSFNAIANCMTALNDNFVCTNAAYAGLSNWDRFLKKMGLYKPNPTQADINYQNGELFAYAFQKRSGQSTWPFLAYVEGKWWGFTTPAMKNKMDSIWSVGHP